MRETVWGSQDVGRAPGCVRTQGTLPGSIWKRGMWRGIATQVRTLRTHGTQEMHRLRQDATPTDQTQGPFLLMESKMQGNKGIRHKRLKYLVIQDANARALNCMINILC